MNRGIQYPGSIPLDTDILRAQQDAMVAVGFAIQAATGTGAAVDGLICTPTTVPSMSVLVGQGSIIAPQTVDAGAYGSIPADGATPLMKMGVNLAAITISPLVAPVTAGQSVVYLVQIGFSEVDTVPVVLPYYNASNPAAPYLGPNNTGTAQNTRRIQSVTFNLKQGSAATTGSQVAPSSDSGFIGLYAITIANGATAITSGNIALLATAPVLRWKLPDLVPLLSPIQFNTSGVWTCPQGVTRVRLKVWGAGGCGNTSTSFSYPGGGGGAGGYAEKVLTVAPGTSYAVTVGAGTSTAGATGSTSSFASLVSAPGGLGGSAGATGAAGAGGSGGSATTGDFNAPGGGGSYGVIYSAGYVAGGSGGAAWSGSGTGATGATTAAFNANGGGFPGGGSSGCTGAVAASANGMVVVEYS